MSKDRRAAGLPRLAAAALVAMLASGVPARAAEVAMTCTNPYSGISWDVRIDYDKRTVDSFPADVSDARISWHDDRDGGNYRLDRATGKLTVVVASSTGGYFLYDRCEPKH